jgi:hypothetical protein
MAVDVVQCPHCQGKEVVRLCRNFSLEEDFAMLLA